MFTYFINDIKHRIIIELLFFFFLIMNTIIIDVLKIIQRLPAI